MSGRASLLRNQATDDCSQIAFSIAKTDFCFVPHPYNLPIIFWPCEMLKAAEQQLAPLGLCSWWRVVLDEAQMVGTGLSSVAVMAGRLHSTHRWAVTGTPIGPGGLDDIQGLLRVLHHDPFCDLLKWKWCVANPYLTGNASCMCYVQYDCI